MPYVPRYNFLTLGGTGTRTNPLYMCTYSELWSINYIRYFYDICNLFLTPLHTVLFGFPRHMISFEARTGMKGIVDWYFCKYYSYIRVYGTIGSPHLLPYFVPDHLLMREISYQTMGTGSLHYF
jgi:hypothetical protein